MTTSYRTKETWLGGEYETLADILAPGLTCVFLGLNPSPISVAAGHYLSGTLGRQFWGFLTTYRILPSPGNGCFPDELLLENGLGITDLAKRPTPRANTLTREDKAAGRVTLREKIERYQPKLLCSVYKGVVEELTGRRYPRQYGLLPGSVGDTRLFAAPFPYRSRKEVDKHMPMLHSLIQELRNDN